MWNADAVGRENAKRSRLYGAAPAAALVLQNDYDGGGGHRLLRDTLMEGRAPDHAEWCNPQRDSRLIRKSAILTSSASAIFNV